MFSLAKEITVAPNKDGPLAVSLMYRQGVYMRKPAQNC